LVLKGKGNIMIENELQYKITKNKLKLFISQLNQLKKEEKLIDPIFFKAQSEALESIIEEMKKDIENYELSKEKDKNNNQITHNIKCDNLFCIYYQNKKCGHKNPSISLTLKYTYVCFTYEPNENLIE
jgi:hypothetical protein